MPNRGDQLLASFSPNSDYIAYTSGESGQYEVYVQPFPPNGDRWTVSSDGGEELIWSGWEKTVLLKRQHFLLLGPVSNVQTASRLKVVKNWLEEVKRLAPAE